MATDEELKRAYKAFKKRLKLARLDDESGLSKGSKRSAIAGITPPAGLPARDLGRARRPGEAEARGERDLFPRPATADAAARKVRTNWPRCGCGGLHAWRPPPCSSSPGRSGSRGPTSRACRSSRVSRAGRSGVSWVVFVALVAVVVRSGAGPRLAGRVRGQRRSARGPGAAGPAPVPALGLPVRDDLALLIAALPSGEGLRYARWWFVALYLHSGLSKLDVSFCDELGLVFLRHGRRAVRLRSRRRWPEEWRIAAILAMPVWEIAVAVALAVPRGRRFGQDRRAWCYTSC